MTRRAVSAVVVAAVLWFGWQRLYPDDEAQIRAVLDRIAAAVGNTAEPGQSGSGAIATVARINALQKEFAPDASVDAGEPFRRLEGRPAIMSAAARVSVAVADLELRFHTMNVTVAADHQSATALVTAEARFDEAGGRGAIDARELEMTFTRHDGAWVIATVTLIQPLERLDR